MNFFCKFPNNFLVFSGFPYNSFSINDAEQVSDIAKVVNMCIYMEFVWHKVLYKFRVQARAMSFMQHSSHFHSVQHFCSSAHNHLLH